MNPPGASARGRVRAALDDAIRRAHPPTPTPVHVSVHFSTPRHNAKSSGAGVSAIIAPYGATYGTASVPRTLRVGHTYSLGITVTNAGGMTWPANGNIHLAYHWYVGPNVVVFDGERTNLSATVAPGQKIVVSANLKAPTTAGNYILKWDMVEEGVSWFSTQGIATGDVPVVVNP